MLRSLQSSAGSAILASCLMGGLVESARSQPANSNGRPGFWEPPIAHGDHAPGCGAVDPVRFIPIHASLIPVGPYQGCVLVWDKGSAAECFLQGNGSLTGSDVDVRWAIVDPRLSPPVVHTFAWRLRIADAPPPPCNLSAPPGYQGLFCAGHCWLPDGRLLVAGGDYWAFAQSACGIVQGFAGSRLVAVFDPNQIPTPSPASAAYQTMNGPGPGLPWTSLHNFPVVVDQVRLAFARWYPTVTLVAPASLSGANPDVYISVAGGLESYEDYDPASITPPPPPPPPQPKYGDPAFNTHELLRFDMSAAFYGRITRDGRLGSPTPPPPPLPATGLFDGPDTTNALAAGFAQPIPLSFYLFPRLHFMSGRTPLPPATSYPNGLVWMGGQVREASFADVIAQPEVWTNSAILPITSGGVPQPVLEESVTLMFPAVSPSYRDWQVALGGMKTNNLHQNADITNETWLIDTRASSPQWIPGPGMVHARKFHNAVIMPDASIIVIGGGTDPGHGVPGHGVQEPEWFYQGGPWATLSNHATERTYHSWALLLPDGRILAGGGDTCDEDIEYEIFVPPNLQGSPARPTILSAPSTMQYGQQYAVQVTAPFAQSVQRIVLLRPGSVTHSQDPGQRYEPLTFVASGTDDTTEVTVFAPANATVVPPGYCMMFLVSSAGVPSFAHWVRLEY